MKLRNRTLLRALIDERGVSIRTLARQAGLAGPGMVCHLLAGRRASCSPYLARRLSEALGVPTAVLFAPATSTGTGRSDTEDAA